ncbi:hypothetical protein JCM3765_006756 [Sporobolomyces pararoseus]
MSSSDASTGIEAWTGGEPKIRSIETVKEGQWIELQKIEWIDEDGRDRVWEMAVRKTTNEGGIDSVAIVALLVHPSRPTSIPIILQYRPPIGKICVELPAGLIDKGETAETAALRELFEETGYGGKAFEGRVKVLEMGRSVANDPALSKSKMILATIEVTLNEEEEEPEPDLDEGEHLEVRVVLLENLHRQLKKFEELGYVVDGYVHHFAAGLETAKRIGIPFC